MGRKTINYEYRKERVSLIISIAIIVLILMIFVDLKSNLVLFPLAFLLYAINCVFSFSFTLASRFRSYGVQKGTRKRNVAKYVILFFVNLMLFVVSIIVLW